MMSGSAESTRCTSNKNKDNEASAASPAPDAPAAAPGYAGVRGEGSWLRPKLRRPGTGHPSRRPPKYASCARAGDSLPDLCTERRQYASLGQCASLAPRVVYRLPHGGCPAYRRRCQQLATGGRRLRATPRHRAGVHRSHFICHIKHGSHRPDPGTEGSEKTRFFHHPMQSLGPTPASKPPSTREDRYARARPVRRFRPAPDPMTGVPAAKDS